ncbi:hypothetical protein CL659_02930 [bacterium]|nr:hypothetical protein [bacterium]|tara:strand:+ start:1582 stop:2541 length:960 start_codon:yes stop_codon:yes gene_type:complete
MDLNFKILLALLVAFCFTGGIFYLFMDLYLHIYDPEWNGIFSEKEIIKKESIFFIGASNVYSIDVDRISDELIMNQLDYEIYNLADMSDTPTRRVNSMMHLVELEPKVIIYGISMTDFEKSRDYRSEFFNRGLFGNIVEPDKFFVNFLSSIFNLDFSEKFPTSPKDRMIQSIKYILRGPDYPTHPFMNYRENNILSQDEIKSIYGEGVGFRGIDNDIENSEFLAVNKIIETFQSNGIKVLIFTPPYNELVFEHVKQSEIENFEKIIDNISQRFDIDILYLHDKYAENEIWSDPYHVAINRNAQIYTDDIKEWMIKELKE